MSRKAPAPPPPVTKLRADPDAERQIIASYMNGRAENLPPLPAIPPNRFTVQTHRLVWGAICDLTRRGEPTGLTAVVGRLRDRGELEEAGGPGAVSAIDIGVPVVYELDHYVRRLRSVACWRAVGALGRQIAEFAEEIPDRPADSLPSRYHALVRRADALCDLASRNGHAATLTTRTIHEILTSPAPPVTWVYEPWLGAGDIVILAGEPGLGKSWVALDLMFALALGRPWGGVEPKAGPQRVLYLDEENNYRLVRHRIGKLTDGLDLGMSDLDPARFGAAYALEQGVNLDDPASLDLLRHKLDQLRPDWIVFDSLIRIHRRDENSNAEMAGLIGGLIKPLAHAVGAGAIIIHHLGKATKDRPEGRIAERIRGASDIRGVADQVWGLERADDGLLLSHLKCRMDREAAPLAVQLEDVHLGNGLRVAYAQQEADSERVIDETLRLGDSSGAARQEIEAAVTALGVSTATRIVTKYLGRLHATGKVRKRKDGRAVRYWLADLAPPDAS